VEKAFNRQKFVAHWVSSVNFMKLKILNTAVMCIQYMHIAFHFLRLN